MDIQEFLSTKRAGAPTWVWMTGGVAVGAAVILYMRQKKAQTSTAGSGSTDPAGTASDTPQSQAAYPMPYSGGDVFVNLPGNTQQPAQPSVPSALSMLQTGSYVVKGTKTDLPDNPNDRWPAGVAKIVYKLGPQQYVWLAEDALKIELMNPGKVPPYDIGATIVYPVWPEKVVTPAPQVTSTTNVQTGT